MPETLQFVAFCVGSQHFGIEIHRVMEVISLPAITPLPGTPNFVEGLIDVRGQLVPVVDLRKRLGETTRANTMQTRILIVRLNKKKTGLIVDAADQVYTVPAENIQPPPEQGSDFVLAVAKQENVVLVILDLEKLLSVDEQATLQSFVSSGNAPRNPAHTASH